ncbi:MULTISPECIES: hypothetical protein [unclassified Streptomyces]|jgi:hypothetical protein|uniref:hypothetical protein n=1 Tax=unclassified Streptomyces TaxID=2593676 RepID=UPI00324AD756
MPSHRATVLFGALTTVLVVALGAGADAASAQHTVVSATNAGPGTMKAGPGATAYTNAGPGTTTDTNAGPGQSTDTNAGPGATTDTNAGPGATTAGPGTATHGAPVL